MLQCKIGGSSSLFIDQALFIHHTATSIIHKAREDNLATLPKTMRALELQDYQNWQTSLTVVEKPIPQPGPNQVVVKMAASPINPADIGFLAGRYGVRKTLPVVPGWEGSGRVVAAGKGWWGRLLLGRRVACIATDNLDGAWAEYMLTTASRCFPLRRGVSDEQGAMMIINPLTTWAMMDQARKKGHRAMVQTGAASAVGRMMLKLGQKFGVPIIHIVRRQAQVDLLRSLGGEYVLSTREDNFDTQLRELCHQLHVTQAFDAVSGEMTSRLLRAMPDEAEVTVYGTLAGAKSEISPRAFIFHNQQVNGFWLNKWSNRTGMIGLLKAGWQVQKLLADEEFNTQIQARVPLEKTVEGIEMYQTNMTKGKVLLVPDLQS
jgi:NADPH:quinone reductase-like Zn-dependent oxidoreductase